MSNSSARGQGGTHACGLTTVVLVGAVEEQIGGVGEHLGAGAVAVVGGEEVCADGRAEGEQAAGPDLVGVRAEGADRAPSLLPGRRRLLEGVLRIK